jgi:glycosyltransferase involved in cell wall biosynthesis
LNILAAIDAPSNPDSGAAGTVYQMSHGLRNLGNQVDNVWADELPHKIKHWNLHYLFELPRAYLRLVKSKCSGAEFYDVIQISQPHAYLAARYVKKNLKKTIFVHQSNGFELNLDENLKPFIAKADIDKRNCIRRMASHFLAIGLAWHARLSAQYSDGTIVSNSSDYEYLINRMRVPKERAALVAQGVADLYLNTPCALYNEQRHKKLLFVGQYAFFKAPHVLGKIVTHIMRSNPEIKMTWVCDQADQERVLSHFDPSYQGRLTCLPWRSQSELLRIYDDHGIFIFPSLFEGFGKVFLEAMSRGLCVVASNCGGMKDVIKNGENGFLADIGNVDDFVRRLNNILGDFHLAKKIAHEARLTSEKYTWRRTAEQMADFYKKLLEIKRGY